MIGVAMFGATVYLSQYFQLARGMSPTEAGLMSIAMVGGLLVSSIVSGRIISDTGLWKRWLVGGLVLVVAGLAAARHHRRRHPAASLVGLFMALVGVGLGATMQNLVLAVQNNTKLEDMGAASSVVAFFRSLGGSIGVSALGAVLSTQVADKVTLGPGRDGHHRDQPREQLDPRPRLAAGPGARPLRARVRHGHRPHLPDRRAVCDPCARVRAVHQGGPAADDRRRPRRAPRTPRARRDRPRARAAQLR